MWAIRINSAGHKFWSRVASPGNGTTSTTSGVRSKTGASGGDGSGDSRKRSASRALGGGRHRRDRELVLVYTPWCGFCKRLMQEGGAWERLKSSHPNMTIREIDADAEPSRAIELGVKTYPDIRAVATDGTDIGVRVIAKVASSESARTLTNLKKFVREHALVPTK
jgi:thiol-disulfide isomerase/thioredoxin